VKVNKKIGQGQNRENQPAKPEQGMGGCVGHCSAPLGVLTIMPQDRYHEKIPVNHFSFDGRFFRPYYLSSTILVYSL
jgi:hypothetical protein